MPLHLHDIVEQNPSQRVDELYVWLAIFPDGAEQILAIDDDDRAGRRRNTPLISPERDIAEKAGIMAQAAQREARERGHHFDVEMRAYRRVPL